MKTGSESMEAIMRKEADPVRGICGVHGGHEALEVRDVRRTGERCGLCGSIGCILGDVNVFRINVDQ